MLAQASIALPPTLPSEYSFNPHLSHPSAVQIQPRPEKGLGRSFALRPAVLADAPAIAELGSSVFAAHFGFSIPPVDLRAYLDDAYSIPAIEDVISNPSRQVVVACAQSDHRVIGFAQLTEGTSEPCLADLGSLVELQRLYVHADFHGGGVGKALTRAVEGLARDRGYRTMWLGVWEGNFRAQKVYEAMGFARVGDHEFKMGQCIQTDWIMCKDL